MRRGQQVQEEFGVETCGAVKHVDAEATQQNVHGLMQAFVQDNGENQSAVDGYYQAIIKQDGGKENHSIVCGLIQPRKTKHCYHRDIIHHHFHMPTTYSSIKLFFAGVTHCSLGL